MRVLSFTWSRLDVDIRYCQVENESYKLTVETDHSEHCKNWWIGWGRLQGCISWVTRAT